MSHSQQKKTENEEIEKNIVSTREQKENGQTKKLVFILWQFVLRLKAFSSTLEGNKLFIGQTNKLLYK